MRSDIAIVFDGENRLVAAAFCSCQRLARMSLPTAPPPARKSAVKLAVLSSDDMGLCRTGGTALLLPRNKPLFQLF
jgi:hypothetical protein